LLNHLNSDRFDWRGNQRRNFLCRSAIAIEAMQSLTLCGTSWQKQRKLGSGRHYIADAAGVTDPDVDLEELARELGVIQSWETLKTKRS
jgi:hypothetical protein